MIFSKNSSTYRLFISFIYFLKVINNNNYKNVILIFNIKILVQGSVFYRSRLAYGGLVLSKFSIFKIFLILQE